MAFEDLKAAIGALMEDISKRPADRHILQEQLREKIAEIEAMGLEAPADYKRFLEELSEAQADDLYKDLPE